MRTFITADPHFAREGENTVGRPFANAWEMSKWLLEQYNSQMNRNDRFIIVGDFSFRDAAYFRQKLVCRNIMLILGNHDKRQNSYDVFGRLNVREQYDTKICGHPTFFSHYPTLYWPKSHYGSFHGYGHVHDQRSGTIEAAFPGIRAMDVGPDSIKRLFGDYRAISDQEFYDLLIARPGHDPVEWYQHHRGAYRKDHVQDTV